MPFSRAVIFLVLLAQSTRGEVSPLLPTSWAALELSQPAADWSLSAGDMLERTCAGCGAQHQTIVYKRLTDSGTIDFKLLMLQDWFDSPVGGSNTLQGDFDLFSSRDDAAADINPWTFCNYNDAGVGFPRDCGPSGHVGGMWNSDCSSEMSDSCTDRGGQAASWQIFTAMPCCSSWCKNHSNDDPETCDFCSDNGYEGCTAPVTRGSFDYANNGRLCDADSLCEMLKADAVPANWGRTLSEDCPAGYEVMTDAADCQTEASSAGKGMNQGDMNWTPAGCSYRKNQDMYYFNHADSGHMPNRHHAPVCQSTHTHTHTHTHAPASGGGGGEEPCEGLEGRSLKRCMGHGNCQTYLDKTCGNNCLTGKRASNCEKCQKFIQGCDHFAGHKAFKMRQCKRRTEKCVKWGFISL